MKSLLLALLVLFPFLAVTQNIEVEITNVRSNRGTLRLGVFTSNENFKADKAFKKFAYTKEDLKNCSLTVHFDLEPGTYGLSILDDENDNRTLDFNFLHVPSEGFGFSNYYHTGMILPNLEKFKITVTEDEAQQVIIKMRYL